MPSCLLAALSALVFVSTVVSTAIAQPVELAGAAAGERFGAAIDLHLDVLVVGAPGASPFGAVRVYRWSSPTWSLEATLTPPNGQAGDGFGESVAVWGDWVAVGLPGRDDHGPDTGAVDLFHFDGASWTHARRVECSEAHDSNGFPGYCAKGPGDDRFGAAVDLWGAFLVVGAPGATDPDYDLAVGAVTQFRFDRPTYPGEELTGRSTFGNTAEPGQEYGSFLAVDEKNLLVGVPGPPGCFCGSYPSHASRPDDRSYWAPFDGSFTWLGSGPIASLAANSETLAAGIVYSSGGQVNILDLTTYGSESVYYPDAQAANDFGIMTALGEDVLLVGTSQSHGGVLSPRPGDRPGEAFVYRRGATGWTLDQELTHPGVTIGDGYGATGALWGEVFVVGAALDDTAGADAGRVFVFGTPTECGDGVVQKGETCDNGPEVPGDQCSPFCTVDVLCHDGYDNDGDGLTDWLDPGCDALAFPRRSEDSEKDPSLPCDDGLDNDGDGLVDVSVVDSTGDPGCRSPGHPFELAACQDLADNDGDALTDFDGAGNPALVDPECVERPWSQDEGVVKLYDPSAGMVSIYGDTGFGTSVGASGDKFIVTSPVGERPVAYRYDGNLVFEEVVSGPSIAVYAVFRGAVAVDGARAMVGAFRYPEDAAQPNNIESVYVFGHDGSGWAMQVEIIAPAGVVYDSEFGNAVGLDGDVAVVGAPEAHDGTNWRAGSAYVYRFDGAQWVFEQQLANPAAVIDGDFGRSVDVSGDWIVVGAPGDDTFSPDGGAAYVYHFDGATWVLAQTFLPDPSNQVGFGTAVSLLNDKLLIGAPNAGTVQQEAGTVLFYRLVGGSWAFDRNLSPFGGGPFGHFGERVAQLGDDIAVTSALGVHLYGVVNGTWAETQLLARESRPPFGDLALLNGAAVVGAPTDGDLGPDAGAAFVFDGLPIGAVAVNGLVGPFALALAAILGAASHLRLRRRR